MANILLASLLALVAPVRCSGCGRTDSALCGHCGELLVAEPVRELPGFVIGGKNIPVVSAGIYAGVRRQVMLDFKNGGQSHLGRTLVLAVSRTFRSRPVQQSGDILVVPVPSSLRGGWNRGYSPSLLLAQEIAGGTPECQGFLDRGSTASLSGGDAVAVYPAVPHDQAPAFSDRLFRESPSSSN